MELYQNYLVLFLLGIIVGGGIAISLMSGLMRWYRGGVGYAGVDNGLVVTSRGSGVSLVVSMVMVMIFILLYVKQQSANRPTTALPKVESQLETPNRPFINQKPLFASVNSTAQLPKSAIAMAASTSKKQPAIHLQLAALSTAAAAQKYLEQSTKKLPAETWIAYQPNDAAAYKILCGPFSTAAAARRFAHVHALTAFPIVHDNFLAMIP